MTLNKNVLYKDDLASTSDLKKKLGSGEKGTLYGISKEDIMKPSHTTGTSEGFGSSWSGDDFGDIGVSESRSKISESMIIREHPLRS